MPFIQSAYSASVFTSSSGSACAENVAPGLQYALQTSQPWPVSHASKKACATVSIDVCLGVISVSSLIRPESVRVFDHGPHAGHGEYHIKQPAGPFNPAPLAEPSR